MGPGRQAGFVHARLQQVAAGRVELADLPDLPAGHLAVGLLRGAAEAGGLAGAGRVDLLGHRRAVGAARAGRQLLERHGGHFDVDVDAVEQRAADLGHVPLDLRARVQWHSRRGSLR